MYVLNAKLVSAYVVTVKLSLNGLLLFCYCRIQVGSQPITSIAWLPMLRLLVTLCRDGSLQVWKTRVIVNPNRPPMQANFFEPACKLFFFFLLYCSIRRIVALIRGHFVIPLLFSYYEVSFCTVELALRFRSGYLLNLHW